MYHFCVFGSWLLHHDGSRRTCFRYLREDRHVYVRASISHIVRRALKLQGIYPECVLFRKDLVASTGNYCLQH